MRLIRHPDAPSMLLVALAAALYLFGLGSPYAPTNGDEMVYVHIARLTAASGHWLPLQSDLAGLRNTKPPLLFWQAMVAGQWGAHWTLFALRLPSVLYTFATASMVGYFAWRFSARVRTACVAAALYLLYFSTFRYGRVYLTSAPETFWMALPMWWLLWLRLQPRWQAVVAPALGWRSYTLCGLALGLGAAYKSFALLAPAGAALWLACLAGARAAWRWPSVWRVSAGWAWSVVLGLGVFALWFVLDPAPQAVWQEFVVGENAGKMVAGQGYWQAAWNGAYPMWTQLLAYPVNAGLLGLSTLGFCLWALYQGSQRAVWRRLTPGHWVLLVWLLVWLVVFTIPSQRSERYVIPAVPALAIAMALGWEALPRLWSVATLLLCAAALVLLARIAWVVGGLDIGSAAATAGALAACTIGLGAALVGCVRPRLGADASLWACLAVYACFGCVTEPLSSQANAYPAPVRDALAGQRVAVPNGFTGQYENYRFVLPASALFPYDAEGRNTGERYPDLPEDARLQRLLAEFDAVVWLQSSERPAAPPCAPQCQVLAQRWHVRGRHKDGEITWDNLWYPQQWLFNREWLAVQRRASGANAP